MEIQFTNERLSTTTIETQLSNVDFHEEDLIQWVEPNERVVRIGCNFGEKSHKDYNPVIKKKNERGRRKKEKANKKRQIQGSGKYMNSQATFYVLSQVNNDKVYKVKVFRNGKVQIPGVLMDNLNDAIYAIDQIRPMIAEAIMSDAIEVISEYKTITRNVIWKLIDEKYIIDQERFISTLEDKDFPSVEVDQRSIKYNPERYPGLVFKIKKKENQKYSTFNIFRSGKINIVGYNDPDQQAVCRNWLLKFINDYKDEFIYNQEEP